MIISPPTKQRGATAHAAHGVSANLKQFYVNSPLSHPPRKNNSRRRLAKFDESTGAMVSGGGVASSPPATSSTASAPVVDAAAKSDTAEATARDPPPRSAPAMRDQWLQIERQDGGTYRLEEFALKTFDHLICPGRLQFTWEEAQLGLKSRGAFNSPRPASSPAGAARRTSSSGSGAGRHPLQRAATYRTSLQAGAVDPAAPAAGRMGRSRSAASLSGAAALCAARSATASMGDASASKRAPPAFQRPRNLASDDESSGPRRGSSPGLARPRHGSTASIRSVASVTDQETSASGSPRFQRGGRSPTSESDRGRGSPRMWRRGSKLMPSPRGPTPYIPYESKARCPFAKRLEQMLDRSLDPSIGQLL
jgi:hypothetical protein